MAHVFTDFLQIASNLSGNLAAVKCLDDKRKCCYDRYLRVMLDVGWYSWHIYSALLPFFALVGSSKWSKVTGE